jgi:NADH:ubiquinone oxidoreductase subunit F (NADH-binding)/NADH:ubiquinone oxidoreductase subunit E
MIVPELRKIQGRYGYLPDSELKALAARIDKKLHQLHEVITFFPQFRLAPPPAAEVKVCRDMACHLAGAAACHAVVEAVAAEFGVAARDASGDAKGASSIDSSLGRGPRKELPPRVEVGWVSCLGQCDGTPAMIVELHKPGAPSEIQVLTSRDPGAADIATRLRSILGPHLVGAKSPAHEVDHAPLPWKINPYLPSTNGHGSQGETGSLAALEPYAAARRFAEVLRQAPDTAARTAVGDALIKTLEVSDLRGMGGAGRPAWTKWKEVWGECQHADVTYIICNGDESEPSTFKDREILLRTPHLVIEGMVLGALLVRAQRGYIYIRHEYHDQHHAVEEEIRRARELGVLGPDVLGTGQPLEIEAFESPGGYVCGEQSALIEAIEEHRAEPRNRPPVIEANGLFNKPTLLNNVETFAWVPSIFLHGGEWYRDAGIIQSPWYQKRRGEEKDPQKGPRGKGLRFFSICGDLRGPGVFEVPVGTTLGELIGMAGGIRDDLPLLAVALSGPSGGFLPRVLTPAGLPERRRRNFPAGRASIDVRELPLDKAELDSLGVLLGAGLLVVADLPGRSMLELAVNATRFFRNESCGKCVPCRVGCDKLVKIGEELMAVSGRADERARLNAQVKELQNVMEQTSICSLGTSASKPLACLLEHDWDALHQART